MNRIAERFIPIDTLAEGGGIPKDDSVPDWMRRFIAERVSIAFDPNPRGEEDGDLNNTLYHSMDNDTLRRRLTRGEHGEDPDEK